MKWRMLSWKRCWYSLKSNVFILMPWLFSTLLDLIGLSCLWISVFFIISCFALLFGGCQIIVVVLVSLPSNKIFICYHMDKKSYSQSFILCNQLCRHLSYVVNYLFYLIIPFSPELWCCHLHVLWNIGKVNVIAWIHNYMQ